MPAVTEKVELGFDENGPGNFFILDDSVQGVLDSTAYVLGGGSFFYDVSAYVTSISVNRGKSRALDRYQAGVVNVTFNNRNRFFDPTFVASPFYGQIVPRRDVRITANNELVFLGTTEDWNLDYAPNGDSTATVSAADGFAFLAGQTLPTGTNPVELSGARVSRVLDSAGVEWPSGARTIDTGTATLQADSVTPADNALQYLQLIESSEPGELFVGKNGNLVFQDRNKVFPSAAVPLLTDNASGITYSQVRVVYGSELLFTQSEVSRKGSSTIVQANDLTAQQDYGVRTLTLDGLLQNTDDALVELATYYVSLYAQPEYRFEQVEIILSQLSLTDQNKILALDLGSAVQVQFTPNGIAPAITKFARVISIGHTASLVDHKVVLGLGTLNATLFQLDDVAFGILDTGTLAF
jgi:hypothetical protein